jgi:RecA/RadA recombinase
MAAVPSRSKVVEIARYIQGDAQDAASKKKRRAALLRSFQGKEGKGGQEDSPPVIRTADQVNSGYYLRRPTGIMQLDVDMAGGFPAGTINCLSGLENAGKSTVLYLTCAMHQRIYGEDSMIQLAFTEGAPDYDYMRQLGLWVSLPWSIIHQRQDDRKKRGLPPFTKQEVDYMRYQVGTVDFVTGLTAETTLTAIIEASAANVYGIIGLDSITSLVIEDDMDKEFDENMRRSGAAMLQTRFVNKFVAQTAGYSGVNQTTLLCTQQMRANNAKASAPAHLQQYLPDFVVGGSQALRHQKVIDIEFIKGQKDTNTKKVNGKEQRTQLGRTVKYKLLKGKAGCHDGITGEFEYSYDNRVDLYETILTEGIRHGAITVQGTQITCLQESSDAPLHAVADKAEFVQTLSSDAELELAIRREILAKAGKNCVFR